MKLVYVIAMGHSGSTLADCILGTHPDFISSGELRYLNWQLYRTMHKTASVKDQDICTCEQDFRNCPFWSKVFIQLNEKTGKDIVANPTSFDTAYFNQFAYQDRGGFTRSLADKVKAFLTHEWCEQGWSYSKLLGFSAKIRHWLENNWTLYESMSEVGQRPVVVDSSKHLMTALLLQQYRPENVTLVFLHRSVEALASSYQRWAAKKDRAIDLKAVVKSKKKFESKVSKYKQNIRDLKYVEITYEKMVQEPSAFLSKVVGSVGARTSYEKQTDQSFYIDPSEQHLAAGNPMRYRGRKQVRYDSRWEKELTEQELDLIKKWYK